MPLENPIAERDDGLCPQHQFLVDTVTRRLEGLDGKVDVLTDRVGALRIDFERQRGSMDTFMKLAWALIVIILGVGAAVAGRVMVP